MNRPIVSLAAALCLSTPTLLAQTAGNLTVERWNNLQGKFSVLELQEEGIGKRAPDITSLVAGAEWTPGQGNHYGLRMRGTITVPETGAYQLFVAGDENTELYLSTDATCFNKQLIAWQRAWTDVKQWDKYASQRSQSISLTAGQKYYIEAQMMEWAGSDHLSIGWVPAAVNWTQEAGVQASQSSTGWGGVASRAVDGNTSGDYSENTVTHTTNGLDSWWQVDLGADREIKEVVIWPRSSNQVRLSNFRVSILDAQGVELTGKDYYTQQGNVGTPNLKWVLPQMVTGRTVRVQFLGNNLAGNGYLSLAEVEVLSQYSAAELIPATQLESYVPDVNDADDDNLPDDWEAQHGLDPTNAFGNEGQYGDFDNDGISNFDEYRFASDPTQKEALLNGLTRERWEYIGGSRITNLTGNRDRFLRQPSEKLHVPNIDENAHGGNHATRYRGTITAPATGDYTFWISGDDEAELWLSDGTVIKDINNISTALTNRYGKQKLAWIQDQRFGRNFTTDEDFDRFATQRSKTVQLVQGQHYYIEVLHKEGYANGHVAVAWQVPGGQREIIPASAFSSDIPEDDDLDDDNLPAAWEIQYGLNPADNGLTDVNDGQYSDPDQDGLNNFAEYQAGTDPFDSDSDDDGQSDGFESARGTDPNLANGSNFFVEVPVDNFTAASAYWYTNALGELVSTQRRGSIDYQFTVATGEAGLFEIRLSAAAEGATSSLDRLPLRLEIDGRPVASAMLLSQNGSVETVYFRTPWLLEGPHTLRIHNDNYQADLRLRIADLDIYRFVDDGSGWISSEMNTQNRLFLGTSPSSATSPAAIEGITSDFTSASASAAGSPLNVQRGINQGIYFDLPLDPSGVATPFNYSFQSGSVTGSAAITWESTNLVGLQNLKVRAGESIRATAFDQVGSGTFTLQSDYTPDLLLPVSGDFEGFLSTSPAAAATEAWQGLDASLLNGASGTLDGNWIASPVSAAAHHINTSGASATLQLHAIDGPWVKVAKIQLENTATGIKAHQVYARYAPAANLGADFDQPGVGTNVAIGAGGYGVTELNLIQFAGAAGLTDLTPSGPQNVTSPIVVDFTNPGDYQLTYTHQPAGGGTPVSGTVNVEAWTADFGSAFQLMTWNRRVWTPALIPENAVVEASEALSFSEATETGDEKRSFTASSYAPGIDYSLVRLPNQDGSPGRILARGEIQSFELARVDQTKDATIVHTYADGTRLMQISLVATNLPHNAAITLRSYFQGTTFENGGNELVLTSADFNQNGISEVYMLWGPNGEPRLCHYVKVTIADQ